MKKALAVLATLCLVAGLALAQSQGIFDTVFLSGALTVADGNQYSGGVILVKHEITGGGYTLYGQTLDYGVPVPSTGVPTCTTQPSVDIYDAAAANPVRQTCTLTAGSHSGTCADNTYWAGVAQTTLHTLQLRFHGGSGCPANTQVQVNAQATVMH